MSLDVYLLGPPTKIMCTCIACGNKHKKEGRETYFTSNITHNLGEMAAKAGIYKHLWRPDEIGIVKAKKLISPLKDGLNRMKKNPSFYRQFEPENKWGTYENFIPWIEEYLKACETYPDALISVSR